jgi:regulator of protease activity HflC (stomatin/prohibitin superfamily)
MNKSTTGPINQVGKIFKLAMLSVVGIFILFISRNFVEGLNVNQIMCIQNPFTGHLSWYVEAGIKPQMFGKVTKYDKRSIYNFSFPVRFNDAGHGTMIGSIQFDMPVDVKNLSSIQAKYGSEEAIKKQLLQTVVNKCLYLTGPMMSSRESYAEKRSYLINYVEDQIENGVYKTQQKETTVKDLITGVEKTVTTVEIVMKDGIPARQEQPILKEFGIKTFNFSIEKLAYDATVEQQIQAQQQMTMAVQTAIAESKKAEQQALTAEANGKAAAAEAKWKQEALKASAVTIAEKMRDSSKLMAEAAEFTKKEQTLLGEGEGNRKRAAMMANGALEQKLEAWVTAQQAWADAFSKYTGNIVPQVQSGGQTGNGAANFMEIMGIKAARDLGIDMSMKK